MRSRSFVGYWWPLNYWKPRCSCRLLRNHLVCFTFDIDPTFYLTGIICQGYSFQEVNSRTRLIFSSSCNLSEFFARMLPNDSVMGFCVGHCMCIVSKLCWKDFSEICYWLLLWKLLSAFPVGRYWSKITTYLSSNQTSQDFRKPRKSIGTWH
jgi:hypothetical protein